MFAARGVPSAEAFDAPVATSSGAPWSGALLRPVGDTYVTNYETTVNGAVDADGTARTMRGVFKDHDVKTGRGKPRW